MDSCFVEANSSTLLSGLEWRESSECQAKALFIENLQVGVSFQFLLSFHQN